MQERLRSFDLQKMKKKTKPYPFIIKKEGKLYKLECFGRCYLRQCDSKGRILKEIMC